MLRRTLLKAIGITTLPAIPALAKQTEYTDVEMLEMLRTLHKDSFAMQVETDGSMWWIYDTIEIDNTEPQFFIRPPKQIFNEKTFAWKRNLSAAHIMHIKSVKTRNRPVVSIYYAKLNGKWTECK